MPTNLAIFHQWNFSSAFYLGLSGGWTIMLHYIKDKTQTKSKPQKQIKMRQQLTALSAVREDDVVKPLQLKFTGCQQLVYGHKL